MRQALSPAHTVVVLRVYPRGRRGKKRNLLLRDLAGKAPVPEIVAGVSEGYRQAGGNLPPYWPDFSRQLRPLAQPKASPVRTSRPNSYPNSATWQVFVRLSLNMFGKPRIVFIAVLCSLLRAATLAPPFDVAQEAGKRNNMLSAWLEFRDHDVEYRADPELGRMYVAAASWVNSYVGEYRAALGLTAAQGTPPAADDPELRRTLRKYQPVDALEAIAAATRDRRVVMINEEHRDSSHRAFTTELLPILRQQGFRYLAAEAFGADIETAHYPKSGRFYIDDSVFADMIRRALELGFTLLPYDVPTACSDAEMKAFNTNGFGSLGSNNCMEGRELGQARNLAKFIEAHPDAKLLVHAGAGHIQKIEFPFGPLMALDFRNLTKIDPLCIDQNYMSEREGEDPQYTTIAARFADRTAPFALRSGSEFFLPDAADGIDIPVIHPRARYQNGRPAWLATGGWRKPVPIADLPAYKAAAPELRKAGTTLLQAFAITDESDAVPVDQFLIADPMKPVPLMLPQGKYRVRVIDGAGKTLVAFGL